jgi:uroporphyrin-III C-methyltransferase / precorrin-2 dehydrogenase / sirohydrochlorin ferrochelatase
MEFSYPVTLDLQERPCVVLGGGPETEPKVVGLVEAGARVRLISPSLTEALEDLGRSGAIDIERREYEIGDLAGAFLAISATADPIANEAAFREARERSVLFNAVDDPRHCDFAAPSVVRRGDFVVAISTGGKAPALAKRVRRELSERFGPEWGTLVEILAEARAEAVERGVRASIDFAEWSRRWESALEHDVVDLVAEGRVEDAHALVRASLEGHSPAPRPSVSRRVEPAGRVDIVGAGPGDPALLTLGGRNAIEAADVVVYDRLVHPHLVSGRTAIYVGKRAGRHCMPQEDINALLVRLARAGKRVVRLKGGDPFLFGRGSEEAEALAAAGVPFTIVPAPTSAIAALAYAGIPVTDRRLSCSVAFVTGHRARERKVEWGRLAASVDTIVVLMGLARLRDICLELVAAGKDPETPAAIVADGTLPEQRVVVSHLGALATAAQAAGITSPALVVIGEVVRLRQRLRWFDLETDSVDRAIA